MKLRIRRVIVAIISVGVFTAIVYASDPQAFDDRSSLDTQQASSPQQSAQNSQKNSNSDAMKALNGLAIKGRAPKTGYSRDQFGEGWGETNGCSTRDIILNRDLTNVVTNDNCQVVSGVLNDPYTGKTIDFKRGSTTSSAIQIDHVVALSDAWQTGAQQLTSATRKQLANDPLELLAVDGPANQQKSDGDAATWLPSNKGFRCEYVARQVAVKQKYQLWVTQAEHDAIAGILQKCPGQALPASSVSFMPVINALA